MGFFGFLELFFLAVGLSADAFAVALCKGLAVGKVTPRQMLTVGVWFGGFQALMPIAGYYLGSFAHDFIEDFDHWIAFVLLAAIGVNMIREAFSGGDCDEDHDVRSSFAPWRMLVLAIATSIDALAAGIAVAMTAEYDIWYAAAAIGILTALLSAAGVKLGAVSGAKYKTGASVAGGVILILLGVKVLCEHLF